MATLSVPGKFDMGNIVMTPGAADQLSPSDMLVSLGRHARGDWGEVDDADRQTNEESLKCGDRLLSAYRSRNGVTFWIITESDRSVTTILMPEEY